MANIDDIFSGGEGLSDLEKLLLLRMSKDKELSIDALILSIEVHPFGVSAAVKGCKSFIEGFGLDDTFKDFEKEIDPIARKYAKIVSEKYEKKMNEDLKKKLEELDKDFGGGYSPKARPNGFIQRFVQVNRIIPITY